MNYVNPELFNVLLVCLQYPGNIDFSAVMETFTEVLLGARSWLYSKDAKGSQTQRASLRFWSTRSVGKEDQVLYHVINIRVKV